jgi:hypothetical protein
MNKNTSITSYIRPFAISVFLVPVIVLLMLWGQSASFASANVLPGTIEGAWVISLFVWALQILCVVPLLIYFYIFTARTKGVYVLGILASVGSVMLFVLLFPYASHLAANVAHNLIYRLGIELSQPISILAISSEIEIGIFAGSSIFVLCLYVVRTQFKQLVALRWVTTTLITLVVLVPAGITLALVYSYVGSGLFRGQWL